MGNNFPSFWSNSEWAGFLGSYLGGIFGGAATLLAIYFTTKETRRIERENHDKNEKEKRVNERLLNRGYIVVEEIDNLGLRLEGYNAIGDIRILETSNYVEFESFINRSSVENIRMNYLKIRNIGPQLAVNCRFKLGITNDDQSRQVYIEQSVPMLQVNQEVFIMAQVLELHPAPQLLRSVEINYSTIAGEELQYRYDVQSEGDRANCIERYYINENGNYKELFSTNTQPVSWIYTSHYR